MQIAQRVGADVGILSDAGESPLAVGDRIKAALGPRGPAVVFDCVGFEATMQVCPGNLGCAHTAHCRRCQLRRLPVHEVLIVCTP